MRQQHEHPEQAPVSARPARQQQLRLAERTPSRPWWLTVWSPHQYALAPLPPREELAFPLFVLLLPLLPSVLCMLQGPRAPPTQCNTELPASADAAQSGKQINRESLCSMPMPQGSVDGRYSMTVSRVRAPQNRPNRSPDTLASCRWCSPLAAAVACCGPAAEPISSPEGGSSFCHMSSC